MERQVAFQEYHPSHDESLIELLMNEDWPLRATTTFTREDVLESIQAGDYGGSHDLTYFVCLEDVAVGLVRLEDVESERVEPSLDIRLRER